MPINPKTLRDVLPSKLFTRALLILVLPLVLVQVVAAYIFYERHWDSVTRSMSTSLAGEIDLVVRDYRANRQDVEGVAARAKRLGLRFEPDVERTAIVIAGKGSRKFPEFFEQMRRRFDEPFMVKRVDDDIVITMQLEDGAVRIASSFKRLASSTTSIFILWMVGASLVLVTVAVLFLRNQIRPISQLAKAADRFGMGVDTPDFKPRGAAEVRQAGRAFLTMRDRIRKQVTSRVDMLAGISHDLRTPLTRLKLHFAMLPLTPEQLEPLVEDAEEMERMITAYLAFARGDGEEQPEPVSMPAFLEEVVEPYGRAGQRVSIGDSPEVAMLIRSQAMRRAIRNLIDNALRYGGEARLFAEASPGFYYLRIDDRGPGIATSEQEAVFRAFTRLEASRNAKTGGVGLGMTIARDIVQGHGGDITLMNRESEAGIDGLRVTITLPRARVD